MGKTIIMMLKKTSYFTVLVIAISTTSAFGQQTPVESFNYKSPTNSGNNVFIGENSGNLTLGSVISHRASDNLAIGDNSLRSITEGCWNISIGANSLKELTTGFGNTAIGLSAMQQTTTGYFNTAIGKSSMSNNTVVVCCIALTPIAVFPNPV